MVKNLPAMREWQPMPVFSSGEFHGLRSLVVYSPWGHKESDITEHLHFLSFFFILLHLQRDMALR